MCRARGRLPASPRRSIFPARADWPTGSCATMSAWRSRPTRRDGFTSSASTTRSASPFKSAFSPAPWVCGPTSSASSSRPSFRFGASRTCFRCQHSGGGPDRHYVPRVAHTTGDLDVHDIGVMADGRIVFVNTLFSCLATLSPTHGFRVFWKPPFISKLAAEDRCHLNGLAMKDGAPRLRDGDEPQRRRQRLAQPARRGRLHRRCREQRRSSRTSCRCRILRAGSTAACGC